MLDHKPTAQRKRGKQLLFKVCTVALGCILPALLLEGAVRVRQYLKYGSAGNSLHGYTVDPVSGLEVPVPSQTTGAIRINTKGFRSPEIPPVKPPQVIRLAFLGASTTFCAEASSNEATWPHLVWKALQEKWPDTQFDYVNGGVPGYVAEKSLRNLRHRVGPLRPDVIVIYHAVNDLSKDSRLLAEQQGIHRGRTDAPSLLGRLSLTWFLVEKNVEIMRRQERAAEGRNQVVFVPEELSRGFRTRLLDLLSAAQNVAPMVAIATFSQRLRKEQSDVERLRASNTHLYYMPHMTIEGLLKGFDEYNRVIREVAHATGALLIEGEETIPADDRHFNDSVHFKDPGCVRMADRVVKSLVASESLRAMISSRRSARNTVQTR